MLALCCHKKALYLEAAFFGRAWVTEQQFNIYHKLTNTTNEVFLPYSSSAKNGMAINSVYTPKEHRNKGYGTATVSELSKNILSSGKKFCTLFADLANPISNSVYEK
jgi:predicted GNAT family acetyltransferase